MKPFTFVKIEWFFLVMNANLMVQCEANKLLKWTEVVSGFAKINTCKPHENTNNLGW